MGDCCSHFLGYFWNSTNVSPFYQSQQQEEERTRLLSDNNNSSNNNNNNNSNINKGDIISNHHNSSERSATELPSLPTEYEPVVVAPASSTNTNATASTTTTTTTTTSTTSTSTTELSKGKAAMAENSNHHESASAPPELHHKGKEDPQFYQDEASEEGPRWNKARPDPSGKPQKQLIKKPGLPKHLQQPEPKYKSNSTSSLYIKDTLSMPDIDELLRCISIAILYHIEAGHASSNTYFVEIFSEEKHPLTKGALDLKTIPNWKRIYKFLSAIFRAERLSSECAILCLAYIERIIGLSGITLHASNWRRVVLAALILASKVWEDQAVWNVDFLSVFPCVTVQDLAQLEKTVLNLLKFNVSLKASLYAKYYFELKGLAEQDGNRSFSLEPLNKEDAEKLEKRSEDREAAAKKEFGGLKVPRSNSDITAKTKPARMVLN
eukprot:TRINITY_DN996_c0_g1_i1.p1 TRINITY_DN996_c0_g1~~TRINITY_DN996_c0_g1_i1.p1  ORF type:complete len:437 (-),score=118.16 TRINITY_DN996_c0_g1_i1:410-1720(-)